jgi:hypothetical protein
MRIKRKRMWLGLGCLLLALGSASAFCFLALEPNRLSKSSFDKLQTGMTQHEVESILGDSLPLLQFGPGWEPGLDWRSHWGKGIGPRTYISVGYCRGTLRCKEYEKESFPEFLTRIKRSLGL